MLLFACSDIEDSDLVKRDTMRTLIMDTNVDYFKLLRQQLAVRFFFFQRQSLIMI